MLRIHGVLLPDGVEREVFIAGGRFTFEPQEGARSVIEDAFLVPGLVDVHAHLALASPAPPTASPRERAEASAAAQLAAGVLAVREPGSPDYASHGIGPGQGLPRVITAGRFLAPPGKYFPGLAREVTDDELPAAAVQELEASGAWVKVIGDTPLTGELTPTFSSDALEEAARRVHAAGGRIAVHCALPEVIQAAIDAGFDSLEHGSFLQSDQVAQVAARGIAWVPTRSIDAGIRQMTRELAPPAVARGYADALDRQPDVLRAAAAAGVTILAGTDAGMGPHGMIRDEVQLLLDAGLSPELALGAASWTARRWLGLPLIEEGAPADLVAYRADPRGAPGELADPAVVVLDGQLIQPRAGFADAPPGVGQH
jgi:imidazolonepropionase-like amidohydrolase